MSPSKYDRQRPRSASSEADDLDQTPIEEEGEGPTFEGLVDERVEGRVAELESEIDDLREEIEAVDNFARISLNERKVKQNDVKLSEFSDSLTGFAEKAFNKLNTLERRIDTHALLLAALVEAQEDADVSSVHKHQSERLVMDATPDERLKAAVEAQASAQVADDD
ncbi:hypothetical protein [Halomarina rubra]|uniref:Uncharacterized protein n=1 Tax=Halomarina rubra TaxID=2071873 RepID=A0ABD6AZ84_9EURY|nr:hypothetical protein [Halomarina rubra]